MFAPIQVECSIQLEYRIQKSGIGIITPIQAQAASVALSSLEYERGIFHKCIDITSIRESKTVIFASEIIKD